MLGLQNIGYFTNNLVFIDLNLDASAFVKGFLNIRNKLSELAILGVKSA